MEMEMARVCPTCSVAIVESPKKSHVWVPIVTALGLSAAALLVYRQIRKSQTGGLDTILDHCARAAAKLDHRLDDGILPLAS